MIFHWVEWPLAWWQARTIEAPFDRLKRHPALFDELSVWPLPGTVKLLESGLEEDFTQGMVCVLQVMANPFQRWAAQQALSDFMQRHPDDHLLKKMSKRPEVIEALLALGDISLEIARFEQSTSRFNQITALSRAIGACEDLKAYVEDLKWLLERNLLAIIVDHWFTLIAKEQGRLGNVSLKRLHVNYKDREIGLYHSGTLRSTSYISSPYVYGPPVAPPIFKGRFDILAKITMCWLNPDHLNFMFLYGHRRMGKTSILQYLPNVISAKHLVVYLDASREASFVESTERFLFNLGAQIYRELKKKMPSATATEPTPQIYGSMEATQTAFDKLLEQIQACLNGKSLILTIDEFEAIEEAVEDHKIDKHIYGYLRALSQLPYVTLVFAGLHGLEEMSEDFYGPFFGAYDSLHVTFLEKDSAKDLITNLIEEFTIDYGRDAAELIIEETGGQLYLVQLVCHHTLGHLNRELFDLRKDRPARITKADLQATIEPIIFEQGSGYFTGVWNQITTSGHRSLIKIIADLDFVPTLCELENLTDGITHLRESLDWAVKHNILQKSNSNPPAWSFCAPLMKKWVQEMID